MVRPLPSLLLFVVTVICSTVHAQDTKGNLLGLNFGASNFHITDEHSSPLIFKGTGIAPMIWYIHKGSLVSHHVEGSFHYDNLSTSASNFTTENFRIRFRYSLFFDPFRNEIQENRIMIYPGLSFTSFYCKSDYYFDMPSLQARSISSWYWSHSLDLSVIVNLKLSERDYINSRLYIPLLSNISRPEFSSSGGYDYEDNDWIVETFGNTVFFPQNFSANLHLEYQHTLSTHLGLLFGYEFYFASYNEPDPVKMYMNNIRLGLLIRLN